MRREFESGRNPRAYLEFAEALLENKRHAQALDVCQRGLAAHPSLSGRRLLAQIYFAMGHYDETLATLESVLKEAPQMYGANLLYAQTLARRREWLKASRALADLIERNRDNAEVAELAERVRRQLESRIDEELRELGLEERRPATLAEFKAAACESLSSKPGVLGCFCSRPEAGNVLEIAQAEALIGLILHKSERIVLELDLGRLQSAMLDYEHGFVIASRFGEEFLVAKFGASTPPGEMRSLMAKHVALAPPE